MAAAHQRLCRPYVTIPLLSVLSILLSTKESVSGADLCRRTRYPGGTIYPLLKRLEGAEWILRTWETQSPRELGRPRKKPMFFSQPRDVVRHKPYSTRPKEGLLPINRKAICRKILVRPAKVLTAKETVVGREGRRVCGL